MGYHNEHHDLPSIPWKNLPKLRAMAPEFYDNLKYHTSWSRLLLQFIFDKRYSLYSRVERMRESSDCETHRLQTRQPVKLAALISVRGQLSSNYGGPALP